MTGFDTRNARLDRLIEILESARQRKEMYFSPVEAVSVINWLHGLRTGASLCGLDWTTGERRTVVERHGLEFRSAAWEVSQLEHRGFTPARVIDELLSLEIEMWQAVRGRTN